MCKSALMDTQELARIVRQRLDEIDRSAASVSLDAVGKDNAIKRINQGHKPSFDRACKLLEALGLQVRVGLPPRGFRSPKERSNLVIVSSEGRQGLPAGRKLEEALDAIRAHWDDLGNDYSRQDWLERLCATSPALARHYASARERTLERLGIPPGVEGMVVPEEGDVYDG